MQYRGYTARMDFDAEDRILVGKVMDIKDIIVFHAESVHAFETAFHTAIDDYILACEKLRKNLIQPLASDRRPNNFNIHDLTLAFIEVLKARIDPIA